MNKLLFLLILPLLVVPSTYAWEFGMFNAGQIYEYEICDYYTLNRNKMTTDLCYDLKLSILNEVSIDSSDVWIVLSEITSDEFNSSDVLNIRKNVYDIKGESNQYNEKSLHNTLFWLPNNVNIKELPSNLGSIVKGELIQGIITERVGNTFKVEFDGSIYKGYLFFTDDLPLPVSGTIKNVRTLQELTLFTIKLKTTDAIDIPVLEPVKTNIFIDNDTIVRPPKLPIPDDIVIQYNKVNDFPPEFYGLLPDGVTKQDVLSGRIYHADFVPNIYEPPTDTPVNGTMIVIPTSVPEPDPNDITDVNMTEIDTQDEPKIMENDTITNNTNTIEDIRPIQPPDNNNNQQPQVDILSQITTLIQKFFDDIIKLIPPLSLNL